MAAGADMFRPCFFVEATAFSIIYMLKKMLLKRKEKYGRKNN